MLITEFYYNPQICYNLIDKYKFKLKSTKQLKLLKLCYETVLIFKNYCALIGMVQSQKKIL